MTVAAVNNAQVIVGTFDVSGFTGQVSSTPGEVVIVPVTTLGSGGFVTQAAGVKSGQFALSGYADHSATGISTAFTPASIGTQYGVSVAVPSSGTAPAAGDPALLGTGKLSQWSPLDATPSSAAAISATFGTDAAFAFGKVGAALASRTTSGLTGTAVALTGPTASQRLYALLHVTAASGTNLVVKVQSDDNSGFTSATDRITFSTLSAVGWERSSVAGNLSTETYWRVTATIASGSFTFAVLFGVA